MGESRPATGSRLQASPRKRIEEATIDLVAERGYEATAVEEVCERASVSPAAFERYFVDLEDCCTRIYTRNNELFDEQVQAAFATHQSWRDSLRAAADFLSARPREVRFNVIAVLSAGDMIAAKRDAYLQRLVGLIDAGRYELEDPDSVSRSVAESAIGAIVERMLRDVHRGGDTAHARAVVPELMYIAVRPYLGHEIASEELKIPPPPEPPPEQT